MFEFRTIRIFAGVMIAALLVPACGPSLPPESTISTAVAQTVQAQAPSTSTPAPAVASPTLGLTDTPAAPPAGEGTATGVPVTASPVAAQACTASASFVDETIPDGTIVQPGSTFTKTWKIQNTGTCYWDTTWQLVFTGGDQLDGLISYSLPLPVGPGQMLDVPIILRAPANGGAYTGEWMLRTPWGTNFGVGQYSVPLVVSIVAGSSTPENRKTETVFDVTNVTYSIDRRCTPANTFWTITAYITTNGPLKVRFWTYQSDGHLEKNFELNFPEATTKSFSWEWSQHKNSSRNPRWAQVIITDPNYREMDRVPLTEMCEFKD